MPQKKRELQLTCSASVEDTSRKVNMSTGMPEEGRDAERMNHINWLLIWQRMGSLEHFTELNVLVPILTSTAVPFQTTWSSQLLFRTRMEACKGNGDCDRLGLAANLEDTLAPE
jgi:hypothetical protein